jgi:TatD DNase family protein
LAQHSKVVAIGECGLDYYAHDPKKTIGHEQRTVQREGFMVQIELAQELKLPLIVHCRASSGLSDDAYQDLLGILQAHIHKLKVVVLHCYMGDTEITKKFLALPGVYFSFAGNITYPVKQGVRGTKDDIQETVKQVPLERMFAETDCPFLAPQDQRGKRNEPAYVRHVAQAVALFKETSSEVVAEAVSENFRFVFGKLT